MNKVKKSGQWIRVHGAREHNLKNISIEIPKDQLTIITGPSGSGKSSLALDILYTEGKRRYMESLSTYARQFLGIARKPDVDSIEGLCPAIAIEQKTVGSNPRSTVGTITEIYDYFRVLFARVGTPHCPKCMTEISPETPQSIAQLLYQQYQDNTILIGAPVVFQRKGEFTQLLLNYFKQGWNRFLINGEQFRFKTTADIEQFKLHKTLKHSIEILIDSIELVPEEQSRLQEALERSFALANGSVVIHIGSQEKRFTAHQTCVLCGTSIPELEPRLFSFNSPIGACTQCHGLGTSTYAYAWHREPNELFEDEDREDEVDTFDTATCNACQGKRLKPEALAVTIAGKSIYDMGQLSIEELLRFCKQLKFDPSKIEVAQSLLREIINRLTFLNNVGLTYLTLNRTARTLSGGEGQRIRLATQIGSALSGVLYILDEPSIGLHQRDNDRLIETLKTLRDQGNSVVVVEHDIDTMRASDYVIDMGPGAGIHGGRIVSAGTPQEVASDKNSLTGAYLSGRLQIQVPSKRRSAKGWISISNATHNNLKHIDIQFPINVLCCVTGVSGSGKSTLVMQELVPGLLADLGGFTRVSEISKQQRSIGKASSAQISSAESIQNLVVIDQTPIGRTPRSNPATYLGIFDEIRRIYAMLPESQARGYQVGRFSFNVALGRCETCRGEGTVTVEMHFLPPVTMICKTCHGKRYNQETLSILYKGKSIADVLQMTAAEALTFFAAHKNIHKRIQLLCDVGLEYVTLGQPSTTLSGGEAQRIKLVDELAKRGAQTMYVLDEPTTGLHVNDIEKLLMVLNRLIDKGNSIVVIEHNLDLIKTADYIIDMGPEGGDKGGQVIAHGTPDQIIKVKESYTGAYLKPLLSK